MISKDEQTPINVYRKVWMHICMYWLCGYHENVSITKNITGGLNIIYNILDVCFFCGCHENVSMTKNSMEICMSRKMSRICLT